VSEKPRRNKLQKETRPLHGRDRKKPQRDSSVPGNITRDDRQPSALAHIQPPLPKPRGGVGFPPEGWRWLPTSPVGCPGFGRSLPACGRPLGREVAADGRPQPPAGPAAPPAGSPLPGGETLRGPQRRGQEGGRCFPRASPHPPPRPLPPSRFAHAKAWKRFATN